MAITVASLTDSPEHVAAVNAELNPELKVEGKKQSVSAKEETPSLDETTAESDLANDESEASDDDASEDQDESKDEEKPKKKRSGFEKRIERFQKRLSEKDQMIELLQRDALKNKANSEEPTNIKQTAPVTQAGKPQPDSFDTHEDYIDALTDWKIDQRESAKTAKAREEQAKTEYQKQIETFQAKVKDFSKATEDFDDVIESVDDIPLKMHVQEAILDSEYGPQIMYALAKDRKELERINGLSIVAAAKAIGAIEAKLPKADDSSKEQPKKSTKAPAPIKPVGGSTGGLKKSIYDPDLSQAEYERLRAESSRQG